jgi:hypothetical protein
VTAAAAAAPPSQYYLCSARCESEF